MPSVPVLKSRVLISALERAGFVQVRQRGSHARLVHPDGRVVTVPIHAGQDVGRGLLRKILRDAELSVDDLLRLM
ncbi:MAG: type II toxin-antitoxin system HicA family toxin [Chloroflexi bacterium]|nr:type II toxin-antitoxin system HicA family toxin [Chloroflexota bacterium]MBP8059780.1 type II toxin-antitoxin system HicA family toxin [Chloroflexota bacterium]